MAIVSELIVSVGAQVGDAERGLASVDRGINSVARSADTAGPGFNAFTEIAIGGLRRIGEIAVNVGFALGGIAAGALRGASDAGMDFEATMSGVQAVLSPTTAEMEALADTALRIGKDTSFGAGEAASAIEMLAKNGVGATDILNGMADATIALAAASGADLSTAADIATDAMAQFKLTTDEVSRAINGISGVTVASKFTIDDYRLALAQAGGVAGGLGVEFEDFNTAIAATSSLFASGSDAGTSFKTFLQRLAPDTTPAKEAMAELGLWTKETGSAFFDAQGNLKSMAEVAELLQGALAGVSEEQRTTLLTNIFGTDAMRTAIGFMDQGAEGFNAVAAGIAEVDAAAQAATRLDNLTGDLDAFKGTLETIGIEAFTAFTPALREGVQALNLFVQQFVGFDYSPFLAGLETVKGAVRGVFDFFQGGATVDMGAWFSGIVTSIQEQLPGWIAALEPFARAAGEWILTGGTYLLENLLTWRNVAVEWLLTNLPGWMDALAPYAVALGQWIIDAIPGMIENFTNGTVQLINIIGANLPGIIAKLGEWGMALVDWVIDAAPMLLENIGVMATSIIDAIRNNLPGIDEGLGGWAGAFVTWALDTAVAFGEMLGPHLSRLGEILINDVFPILQSVGMFLAENLPRALEVVTPLVIGLIDTGLSILELTLVAIAETWNTYLVPAFEGMSTWLEDVTGGWDNLARGAQVAKDILGEIAQAISDIAAGNIDFGQIGRGFNNLMAGDFSGFGIPGFAGGVNNFRGGLAMVGERGPELVNLPGGSDVIPNNMLGGMGGGTTNVYVTVQGNVTTERDLGEAVRLYLVDYNQRNG